MSNALKEKDATRLQDAESVIETIKSLVKLLDCVALVGVVDPEVSGIVTADGETFRDVLPLGDGVHIVLSVGNLSTSLAAGIHEIEV